MLTVYMLLAIEEENFATAFSSNPLIVELSSDDTIHMQAKDLDKVLSAPTVPVPGVDVMRSTAKEK